MAKKKIKSILSGDKKVQRRGLTEKFLKLLGKYKDDKKKIRELEMNLLQPKPIPKYKGPKVQTRQFKKRSIIVAFPNSKHIDRWGEHFNIARYIDNNTWDTDFLIELFNKLDSGRLEWDQKKKKFKLKIKDRKITI